jgi:eukaryotic-like serine/threonine-protein kinase
VSIGVGQILDKYELLEEVGHGGMAVVYRGLDRSLRREVAVKVLHRHLADHQEARDRFEREAQAVAKLRHENILEIFDFSGQESGESYIVTEFIDGQTLKQFITAHPIQYPEIAALVCAQVAKALKHAHGLGILHRDVKPENVMVRNDGIVKLMDFGIAQMIDLQRMTVTGQLLGSPAYMSPEHVEGKNLDFRTDVFAVGILLYQLATGELPFLGKNPHEILKKIAECKYRPAHQANPRVGRELDAIIAKAMAREPDDRYRDVAEMLVAMEKYLDGSGMTDQRVELQQYFAAPASYELAFRARLIDALLRRARTEIEHNQTAALELCNRILVIDPDNRDVQALIDRMSRRRRLGRMALLAGGVVVLAGAVLVLRAVWPAGGGDDGESAAVVPPSPADAGLQAEAPPDAAERLVVGPTGDAGTPAAEPKVDAGSKIAIKDPVRPPKDPVKPPADKPDAGVPVVKPTTREMTLVVGPVVPGTEYSIEGGPFKAVRGRETTFTAGPDDNKVTVRNPCCIERTYRLDLGGGVVEATLSWKLAKLLLTCDVAGVTAQYDRKSAALGREIQVPIKSGLGDDLVEVVFFTTEGQVGAAQKVHLRSGQTTKVPCVP